MSFRTQLRYLRLHALISSGLIFVVGLGAFSQANRKFDTIDVQRINVIEKDGTVRLVISNKSRSPAPMERGQQFGYQPGNRAGLIFYNDEGTEDGGLIFSGARDPTGKYEAVGSLTFDQYEQDQTIALQYIDG